jgi:hypothetical protein
VSRLILISSQKLKMVRKNSSEALRLLEAREYYLPGGKNRLRNTLPNRLRVMLVPYYNNDVRLNSLVNRLNGGNTRVYSTLHHFISQNIPRQRERAFQSAARVGSQLATLLSSVRRRRARAHIPNTKGVVSTAQLERRLGTIRAKRNFNKEVNEMLKKYPSTKKKSPSPVRKRRVSI